MTTRIALLTADVVDKIAAGEVVERPASVVKELVENAIDAGAKRITIEAKDGGKRSIRVIDDGCGMNGAEAELAVCRHATSKLREVADLEVISTLGFRGEGLSSIAAVSKMTMITRAADDQAGWKIQIDGGARPHKEPAARAKGTTFIIENLFYNTPARMKFLKSTATEAAQIGDVVSRLAYALPGVQFCLRHNDREIFDLPPAQTLLERARAVVGRRGARLFSSRSEEDGVSVEACLVPPDETLASARQLSVLINGRPIRERALMAAITRGYGERIAAGRYPIAVVDLRIDPRAVDVNVHPQKHEVRFSDPRRIYDAIEKCVRSALDRRGWEGLDPARSYPIAPRGDQSRSKTRRMQEAAQHFWSAQTKASAVAADTAASYYGDGGKEAEKGPFARLRVIGQALSSYLVCEDGDGLVLISVVAARKAIALAHLERTLKQKGAVESQRLLIPATVTLSAESAKQTTTHLELICRLGVEIEHFGGNTFTVRAIPEALRHVEPQQIVEELLKGIAFDRDLSVDSMLLRLAAAAADPQGAEAIHGQRLLAAMDRAEIGLDRVEAVRLAAATRTSVEGAVALRLNATVLDDRTGEGEDKP